MEDRAEVPLDQIGGISEFQRVYTNIYQVIIGRIENIGGIYTLLDGRGRCEGFRFQSQSGADVENLSWVELRISYKEFQRGLVIVTLSDGLSKDMPVGAGNSVDVSGDYYFQKLIYIHELQGFIDFIYGRGRI